MAKVSVIIPCYNQGQYIKQAVESIQSQTFYDWEIIIVNDGSNDKTIDILNTLDTTAINIIHTTNKGVAAARNAGIRVAKGSYILPLDGDDLIGENYLKEAVEFLDANEEVKVVYCNAKYFEQQEGLIVLPDFDIKKMLQQNLIFCTAMYRKKDWLECNGYDEHFLTGWEDWDLWLRLINNNSQVYKLPAVHFYYRIKQESRNAALKEDRLQQAEVQLYNKHVELYRKYYPKPVSLIRHYENLLRDREQYEKYKNDLQHSVTYRVGKAILRPLNFVKQLFK